MRNWRSSEFGGWETGEKATVVGPCPPNGLYWLQMRAQGLGLVRGRRSVIAFALETGLGNRLPNATDLYIYG